METYFSTTEIIGYLASLAVLTSFLLKDMTKLRLVNMVGCFLFIIYGFMLAISWPIIITNSAIIVVNTYHLLKNRKA
jgi:hypothetical protein